MSSYDRPRRLYRSRDDRWIAGVCGGIAEYFGWNSTLVRLAFVASLILPGTQVIIYLAAWIIMPNEPRDRFA
jgi:phage shock protein PspC (stress-responsive transcriptional regulator)